MYALVAILIAHCLVYACEDQVDTLTSVEDRISASATASCNAGGPTALPKFQSHKSRRSPQEAEGCFPHTGHSALSQFPPQSPKKHHIWIAGQVLAAGSVLKDTVSSNDLLIAHASSGASVGSQEDDRGGPNAAAVAARGFSSTQYTEAYGGYHASKDVWCSTQP